MPFLPPGMEYITDPTRQFSTGLPRDPNDSSTQAFTRYRTDEEINSLLDLINSQTVSGGEIPGGTTGAYVSGAGSPLSDPGNWKITRGDLESPLAYMAGGMLPGRWKGNDRGGYFTLNQLYGLGKPGGSPYGMPGMFQRGGDMPS